ncbi:Slam-dependent surface lipoprotein, partial [Ursidibacter arcticus]
NPQAGNPQAGNPQQGGRGQRPPMASGSSKHANDKGGFFYDGMRRSFPNAIATDFGVVLPVLDSSTSGFSEHAQRLGKLYISDPKFSSYFGYFAAGGHSTIFYQGSNLTAESEIPQSGTAKYVGDSIYVNKGKVTTQVGKVDLTADFANKNLTGTVFAQQGDISAVTIKDAKLDKNTFSGSVVQAGSEAQLHGKFYGKDAAELSGAYSDNQGEAGLKGAFGAKKQ